MTGFLAATRDGIHSITAGPTSWEGYSVGHVAVAADGLWSILDGSHVALDDSMVVEITGTRLHFVLPTNDGVLVGAADATLFRLNGELEPDPGFASIPDRESWYTPWGAPPDVRSMAVGVDGALYVNVHVGGVLRRATPAADWESTMDIDADVHQVVSHPSQPGVVAAATARGLALSTDAAATWTFITLGLHATYCRAVAVTETMLYVSASRGPRGQQAAVYSTAIGDASLQRLDGGIPEWFDGNIDTGCLQAVGNDVAIAEYGGTVWTSADGGANWSHAARDLPRIYALAPTI